MQVWIGLEIDIRTIFHSSPNTKMSLVKKEDFRYVNDCDDGDDCFDDGDDCFDDVDDCFDDDGDDCNRPFEEALTAFT